MTISVQHDRLKFRVYCDATGCEQVCETGWIPYKDVYEYRKGFSEALAIGGWTCYRGRSERHYCPIHAPRPGHSMRLMWGDPR